MCLRFHPFNRGGYQIVLDLAIRYPFTDKPFALIFGLDANRGKSRCLKHLLYLVNQRCTRHTGRQQRKILAHRLREGVPKVLIPY